MNTAAKKQTGRRARANQKTSEGKVPEGLTLEDLDKLYSYMVLNRAFDDRITSLYRRGQIPGAAYGSRGQEATSVGAAYALAPEDVVGPLIRNAGVVLVRGVTPRAFLSSFLGRSGSPTGGKDGNSHFGDLSKGIVGPISMLGSMIPTLAGCALAFQYRNEKRVALTFIGDGGSSTGEFHEGLNMAATMNLPFVLVLEHNGYAYSTPTSVQTRLENLVDKARGYGIPGEIVDGNDVLAVYETVKRAVEADRQGNGPTLIEAKTFRIRGHAEHDDARYVPKEVTAAWLARDPIENFGSFLIRNGHRTSNQLQKIQDSIHKEMEVAEEEALAEALPDPESALGGVYAD